MAYKPSQSPFSDRPKGPRSVMFAAYYDDGRNAYFVIQGHGGPEEDYRALAVAQERQATGELPEGAIRTVKRVR